MQRDDGDLARLGGLVKDRRRQLGLTQAGLGARIGWGQERLSLLENAKYGVPSLPALVRLADALEMPLLEFLSAAGYGAAAAPAAETADRTVPDSRALLYTLHRLLEIDGVGLRAAVAQAADLMSQAMGAEKVDVFAFEPESSSLVALGTSNTPMGRLQHDVGLDRLPLANGGRTVEVFEMGRPFHTGRADEDPEIETGVVRILGVRSMYVVPIRWGAGIRGVLAAASSQPDRFTEEERHFFDSAARWIESISQRAALSDELISSLAHDLGNHLTPLKGHIDLLRRRMTNEGRDRDAADLEAASRAVADIEQMIGRMLESTRLDRGQ